MATESTSGDEGLAAAVGNYVLGRISLGKAAERAGMTRWEFEEVLSDAGFEHLYGPRTRGSLDSELETVTDPEDG
jgi:predicted HTH domain antitoxin